MMKRSDLERLSRQDLEHVVECIDCGDFFDTRNLDEAIFHALGHEDRPDMEYGTVTKLRVCADCDGTMHFVRRRWRDFVGFWKCYRCARIEWTGHTPKICKPGEIRFS